MTPLPAHTTPREPQILLREHHLRVTSHRYRVLEVFLANAYALSHQFIEQQLHGSLDRVTIYRTLQAFEKSGLIHRVADERDTVLYALCNAHDCGPVAHADHHLHFKCEQCGLTRCMDTPLPVVQLPDGFQPTKWQFLVIGTCNTCEPTTP